ncbi:aromatic acid exporter family protein [Vagococcus coleopterorum]|uniref:Aromatic acid exporter family protein n=1 Tax=Vagococcus coleopterorum TaxID=2714946 RepID=A0A6G8APS4_9ENTE|nr:aromatic acid exporter family protein [Vagococcus coleopterorum]QIL46935.1 aromatic acid exporter family protein [Vagococcus coleopterorum]
MQIKIGMRTIKTAVCAAIAIMLANFFHLASPTAAGIIALLSVTNTRRSSLETGIFRITSMVVATIVAFVCFNLIGYNAIAFGFFLLFFIPLAVRGNMSEGIAPSSVLVTHFLIAQEMTWGLVGNAFYLLFIGVGVAWVANLLLMPDSTKELEEGQKVIDEKIRQLLTGLSFYLGHPQATNSCDRYLSSLIETIDQSETKAHQHNDNKLLEDDIYFADYFSMRRLQVNILEKMNRLVKEVSESEVKVDVSEIQELFLETATALSEDNDTAELQNHLGRVLNDYREADLPATREEFEMRARLYLLLNEFDRFLNIKMDFHEEQQGNH